MSPSDFFIGWSAETPAADRRFFLKAGIGLMAGTGAVAAGVAALQKPPGPGAWNMAEVREWTGIATAEPYSMLRTLDLDGSPRTAILACMGKCGVAARIGAMAGQAVKVRGSLIQRGRHAMIAVVDDMDWIEPLEGGDISGLAFPTPRAIRDVKLRGEILDTKCWFGAMSPNEGKVHKSCASLCIRGGIPPGFYVKAPENQSALMVLTQQGQGVGADVLEFVGEPVEISGQLQHFDDLRLLDIQSAEIRRI